MAADRVLAVQARLEDARDMLNAELKKQEPRDNVLAAIKEQVTELHEELKMLTVPAGLQGNVLQKILETQQLLVEQTNTATYSLAYMLARSSPYELHKAPSSANSNPELKKSLISTYGLMDRKGADGVYLRCQATGEILLSGALVAGHLFPRESAAFGKEWGLINPDNDVRNALVWFDGIEQAWSDLRFCLVYEQGVLRLQVLDETLLDISPVALAAQQNRKHATERLCDMTFRELDGRAIYFPAEVHERPYHRVVVTQAAHAITAMWKAGKLRKDVVPFRLDVLSEFDQKDACLAWVKTTMVHFPEWPVGPEPEPELEPITAVSHVT